MDNQKAKFAAVLGVACLICLPALADVVPVMSARSAVTTLTRVQLADIFLCRRTRFPDGSSAIPVDQPDGSGARDDFYARFAGMNAGQLRAFWSRIIFTGRGQPPRVAGNLAELKKLLNAQPGAIAYIESEQVDASLKVIGIE